MTKEVIQYIQDLRDKSKLGDLEAQAQLLLLASVSAGALKDSFPREENWIKGCVQFNRALLADQHPDDLSFKSKGDAVETRIYGKIVEGDSYREDKAYIRERIARVFSTLPVGCYSVRELVDRSMALISEQLGDLNPKDDIEQNQFIEKLFGQQRGRTRKEGMPTKNDIPFAECPPSERKRIVRKLIDESLGAILKKSKDSRLNLAYGRMVYTVKDDQFQVLSSVVSV